MILPQLEQALRSSSISACSTQRRSDSGATPSSSATARNGATRPAAERAAADLLAALGVELNAEHLREMPRRVAQAYAELLTPRPFNPTTFPNDEPTTSWSWSTTSAFSPGPHHLLPLCCCWRRGRGAARRRSASPRRSRSCSVEVRLGRRDDAS